MARKWFDAQIAQYAHRRTEGNGLATWQGDVTCHLPSLTLYGESRVTNGLLVSNNATVQVMGSNLLPDKPPQTYNNGYGITLTVAEDQSVVLTGTSTAAFNYKWYDPWSDTTLLLPKGRYAFVNRDTTTTHTASYLIQCFDPATKDHLKNVLVSAHDPYFTVTEDYTVRVCVWWNHTVTFHGERYQMQLSAVGEDGVIPPYETYVDGGTVSAPYLHGIPGTPYRDEWDAVTGRGVRRCRVLYNYGGEAITTPYLCTSGALEEGSDVVFGIPDTPFTHPPAVKLRQPAGAVTVLQTGGDIPDCPLAATGITHTS